MHVSTHLDHQIGRLIQALVDDECYEDTMIVFSRLITARCCVIIIYSERRCLMREAAIFL